ncbi:hypothetical protein EJ04DRAFT_80714 [Polyplosphaeria fusca]|uniref:Uncharacterized protein n=1 Tax=Polyplosphaeria fusca TaxID=682080 RepID=A0A9P4R7Q7_9PLEO|nr:hypothetical protein EJ04DRAFT_80714 [Polyplosphaeria fusca]
MAVADIIGGEHHRIEQVTKIFFSLPFNSLLTAVPSWLLLAVRVIVIVVIVVVRAYLESLASRLACPAFSFALARCIHPYVGRGGCMYMYGTLLFPPVVVCACVSSRWTRARGLGVLIGLLVGRRGYEAGSRRCGWWWSVVCGGGDGAYPPMCAMAGWRDGETFLYSVRAPG